VTDAETLAKSIGEQVTRNRDASFAELANRWPSHFRDGDFSYEVGENVIIWSGMSQVGWDAIQILRKDARFEFRPTSPLVYLADGAGLRLPIAKRAKYKKLHWLPCVIVPVGLQKLTSGAA
jgi:hypothetical protein